MNADQWTRDWDERFQGNDTPWEEEAPPGALVDLVGRFVGLNAKILEVGCGLGANVSWLLSQNLNAYGCDISSVAIRKAERRGLKERLFVSDMTQPTASLEQSFDVVIDRGVLHTFSTDLGRRRMLEGVAYLLVPGGLLLSIAGSFDEGSAAEDVVRFGLPRLKASEILSAAEHAFQLLEMTPCMYGEARDETRFRAWSTVLQKG